MPPSPSYADDEEEEEGDGAGDEAEGDYGPAGELFAAEDSRDGLVCRGGGTKGGGYSATPAGWPPAGWGVTSCGEREGAENIYDCRILQYCAKCRFERLQYSVTYCTRRHTFFRYESLSTRTILGFAGNYLAESEGYLSWRRQFFSFFNQNLLPLSFFKNGFLQYFYIAKIIIIIILILFLYFYFL